MLPNLPEGRTIHGTSNPCDVYVGLILDCLGMHTLNLAKRPFLAELERESSRPPKSPLDRFPRRQARSSEAFDVEFQRQTWKPPTPANCPICSPESWLFAARGTLISPPIAS